MMKSLGLVIILLLSSSAMAAEWVRLRPLVEGDQYFYDRSKLYINGDEITYWKKVSFRIPVTVKNQAAASGLYRERIHCAEHTLKLISYLLYAADGSTIEYVSSHEGEAAPIIPDTVGDIFEKTACELIRQSLEAEPPKRAGEGISKNTGAHEQKIDNPGHPARGAQMRPPAEKPVLPGRDDEQGIPASPPSPLVN